MTTLVIRAPAKSRTLAPQVKFILRLKDSAGKVLSEGSESFIKKTTSRVEGGLPKVLDYGPHDVTFRQVVALPHQAVCPIADM